MQILFGESLRRLRREKGLTQEQLAARLNVSYQTISNWERDENWPDLSMLPVLARFFGVRTDDLLGIDQAENERRIQEILDLLGTDGRNWEQTLQAAREALKEFPMEYRLWGAYFNRLTAIGWHDAGEGERMRARLPEIRSVYSNILENCTNDAIRLEAKSCLCLYYGVLVKKEPEKSAAELKELRRIIGEFPGLWQTREYMGTFHLLPHSREENRRICHEAILQMLRVLNGMMVHLGNTMDKEEHLPIEYALLDIFNAVCPDGDYGAIGPNVFNLWEAIALGAAHAGNCDAAFAAIGQCIEIARRFEELPQTSVHTSPMLRGHVFDKSGFPWLNMNQVRKSLRCEEHTHASINPWPEAFKADPRFAELLALAG
ncbi:MAG: helix-turn-helix domain-containing protein [Oscillospiraceae bacterium]|nr:helix-turn-helix domain-containing protein [Oscillospiraceae bacterium]